jgi:hypothetical protein
MSSRKFPILAGAAMLGIALAAPPAARANPAIIDTYTSTLNVTHGLGSGPYGTVQVDLYSGSKTAMVTFNADSGFQFYDSQAMAVNVNNGSYVANSIAVNCILCSASVSTTSAPVDNMGTFEVIASVGSFSAFGKGSFDLSHNGSGTWSSAANVLEFTSGAGLGSSCPLGCDAAAHMITSSFTFGYAGEMASAPAPSIGQGLPIALAVGGVFAGARLLGRGKKRSAATALPA